MKYSSALAALFLSTLACSSAGMMADGGPDASQPCTATLEMLQAGPRVILFDHCPNRWAEASASTTCLGGRTRLRGGLCGAHLVREDDRSTHSQRCYYDPTTMALVGAAYSDDVNTFCSGTSSTIQAGVTPACTFSRVDFDPCSTNRDAGTD